MMTNESYFWHPDAITVWPFHDAPEVFKALSESGGDEDWLAFVPDKIGKDENGRILYIGWLDHGSFGASGIDRYEVDGGTVYIGGHS